MILLPLLWHLQILMCIVSFVAFVDLVIACLYKEGQRQQKEKEESAGTVPPIFVFRYEAFSQSA